MIPRRPFDPLVMPRWGWVVLAALTALALLPVALRIYGLWWEFVMGPSGGRGTVIEFLLPRAA